MLSWCIMGFTFLIQLHPLPHFCRLLLPPLLQPPLLTLLGRLLRSTQSGILPFLVQTSVVHSWAVLWFLGTLLGFILVALLSSARLLSFLTPVVGTWRRMFQWPGPVSFWLRELCPFRSRVWLWYRRLFVGIFSWWSAGTWSTWSRVQPSLQFAISMMQVAFVYVFPIVICTLCMDGVTW